jgi:hypothetical protein
MKAVALLGEHKRYQLKAADLAISSMGELSVYNVRRLFANRGADFMDLNYQPSDKAPPKRALRNSVHED